MSINLGDFMEESSVDDVKQSMTSRPDVADWTAFVAAAIGLTLSAVVIDVNTNSNNTRRKQLSVHGLAGASITMSGALAVTWVYGALKRKGWDMGNYSNMYRLLMLLVLAAFILNVLSAALVFADRAEIIDLQEQVDENNDPNTTNEDGETLDDLVDGAGNIRHFDKLPNGLGYVTAILNGLVAFMVVSKAAASMLK